MPEALSVGECFAIGTRAERVADTLLFPGSNGARRSYTASNVRLLNGTRTERAMEALLAGRAQAPAFVRGAGIFSLVVFAARGQGC